MRREAGPQGLVEFLTVGKTARRMKNKLISACLLLDNSSRQKEIAMSIQRITIAIGLVCAIALLLSESSSGALPSNALGDESSPQARLSQSSGPNRIAHGSSTHLPVEASGSRLDAQGYEFGKAQWEPDGVSVCLAAGFQGAPHVTTDDAQGVIVAWADCRPSLADCDIYAQRIDIDGSALWQPDGVPVNSLQGDQLGPRVVGDGAGGALVAWSDYRNHTDSSVFAQRLDNAGNRLWASEGITVATGIGHQTVVQLIPDGVGGAFAIWQDWLGHPDMDKNLFVQRLDGEGTLLWSAPVTITDAPHEQFNAHAALDGAGGLLVTWGDSRDPEDANIYAQRVSADGAILWELNGVLVSADPALQRPGSIITDGIGGAYVTWYDFRANYNRADAYMQRLTAEGLRVWAADLPVVADSTYAEGPEVLVSDGSSGVIVISSRSTNGAVEVDILAQHVSSEGEFLWGAEPINITPWAKQQEFSVAVPDGQGGAYIAWIDKYTDSFAYDVWTQHLGADGSKLWPGHGVQAVGADGSQELLAIVSDSDSDNGFIVAWQDWRDSLGNPDLYVQHIVSSVGTRCFLPLVLRTAQ